jgi:Holliday junction resolvasome RuvABC endonuclease subunit
MIIAGFDLSLRGTGIFIKNLDTGKTYFYYFTTNKKDFSPQSFYIPDTLDQEKTIDAVIKIIKDILRNHKIDKICMEDVVTSIKGDGNWKDLYGVFKYILRQRDIEYIKVSPPALKKYATGSGAAKKPQMGFALRQDLNLDYDYLGDEANNVVDAAWCCDVLKNYLSIQKGSSIASLPEQKQDLIATLCGLKVKVKKPRKKKEANGKHI